MNKNKLNLYKLITFAFALFLLLNVNIRKSYAAVNYRFIEQLKILDSNSIELQDENVTVDVKTGNVTIEYKLYNDQDKDLKITASYPQRNDHTNKPGENNTKNFNVYVNDEYVIAEVKAPSNTYTYNCNYDFKVDIKAKQTSTVKISYQTTIMLGDDSNFVIGSYRSSGGPFKGNIKHSKITFDFTDISNYYVISPNDDSTYKKVDSKYVWEAENYKAKNDISLLARLKLTSSQTSNLSYYDTKKSLNGIRILIDVESSYTKTQIEKEAIMKAAETLKNKLIESGAECAISNNIEELEKFIKKEAKFDYVVTLICRNSNDPNLITKELFVEPLEKGDEDRYLKSCELAKYIQNAGVSGIPEYFTNLVDNDVISNKNVLRFVGSLDVSKTVYDKSPRIIISLGYISDPTKCYLASDGIMEKTRLGFVLNEDNKISESKNKKGAVITKANYKITQGKKNIFQRIGTRISKFFKYNIVTIISSVMIGIGIAIVICCMLVSHYDKKMKVSYDDIKKKEKELENKINQIEKEKIESEKHKENLKEIIKERLRLLKEKNGYHTEEKEEIIKIELPKENKNEIENEKENLSKNIFDNQIEDINGNSINDPNKKIVSDKKITEENNNDDKNVFKKLINKTKLYFEERKLNKFSKASKSEAKKYISKINIKNISK